MKQYAIFFCIFMLRLFWDSVILGMYEVEKNIISAYII